MEWQPIESAPKMNGQEILVCSKDGRCSVVYWEEDEELWVTDYRGKGNYQCVGAAFWMPLPAPPKETE